MTTALQAHPFIEVVPFEPSLHLASVLDVIRKVADDDRAYPPSDAGTTESSLTAWLLEGPCTGRWVALADGQVAGHIMTAPAHDYLTSALSDRGHNTDAPERVCEIGRFFTDPEKRGIGLGSALFATVCAVIEASGLQPALAVLDGSHAARGFYATHGMQEVGAFVGTQGLNHVFIAEPASSHIAEMDWMCAVGVSVPG